MYAVLVGGRFCWRSSALQVLSALIEVERRAIFAALECLLKNWVSFEPSLWLLFFEVACEEKRNVLS